MATILNQRQYRITKSWVRRFEKTLADFLDAEPTKTLHPKQRELEELAIRGQLETLQAEVAEYEALLSNAQPLVVDSMADLPRALIRARISADMTQKELAERLGLREQQIQRYESSRYQGASLERITAIMAALDLEIINMQLRFAQSSSVRG
jgi:ribosome-binding protein aMBF1 (putative translation factor)